MRRSHLLLLPIGVLITAALPGTAQKFLPKTIQFKGDAEYSDQELLAAADLKKGAVLSSAEMNEHSKRLMDSGVFDNLTFKFDGQDLIYYLTPAAALLPVHLDNLPLVPGNGLDAKLHERFPLYHGKVPAEGTLLDDVRGALGEMLAAEGIKATVSAVPSGALGSHKMSSMNFSIATSPVLVGSIHVEGASPAMQAKIKSVVDEAMKTPFDTSNTERNLVHTFESFYADEGYAAVKVHAAQAGNPVATADAIDVPFSVTVEEGKLYKLGDIRLPSGELLTLAEINKAAGVVSNSLETMSIKEGTTFRTALLFVTGDCKSTGHMDCIVIPHPQYDDVKSIVNYTFEVQPGPVYTMGKLTIDNASDDLRSAMLADWKLPAGAVFSEKAIQDYYASQGNKTALGRTFSSLNCKYKLAANEETHIVDVTLSLEKKQ